METEGFAYGFWLLPLFLGIVALVLYIWSIIWVYRDAEKRGKPGILVALLVALLSWPLSLVLWLVIRPQHTLDSTMR